MSSEEKIWKLVLDIRSGKGVDAHQLSDAFDCIYLKLLPLKIIQCLKAEIDNYIHHENDIKKAMVFVGNKRMMAKLVAHALRRRKIANKLFEQVSGQLVLSSDVKEAFGIITDLHEKVFRRLIQVGNLSRDEALVSAYNGVRLMQMIGDQKIEVPLTFFTKDDIFIRKALSGAPEKIKIQFEQIYSLNYKGKSFSMHVGNPVELWRVTTFQSKEPETVRWVHETVCAESVFCDVGSNIGIYSLLALACHESCRVICFEPDPLNFSRLAQNIHLNRFVSRAALFPLGLSDRFDLTFFNSSSFVTGKAENWATGHGGEESFDELSVRSQDAAMITGCAITTLDEFLSSCPGVGKPTHLKIDVDGPEMRILKGAEKTLRSEKMKHILVELFEDEVGAARALLEGFGFEMVGEKIHSVLPSKRGHLGNRIFRRRKAG